ncbi:MAG: segregation/condensation protein A [Kiritimatiellae bacterium]|nr:segregation/condensation protein A [Kiritimatiellia bacterium]
MSPVGRDYKVRLEVFEGPLDLLLYLIRREELNIYDIPIERITTQYLEYLDMMRMLDLSIAGEFLVMAATLMMIKSRMLLPPEERTPEAGEEEEPDPRWDLVRRLVEYKKFKDAARFLEAMERRQSDVFTRHDAMVSDADAPVGPPTLADVSIFDLLGAFQSALKRIGANEDLREIFAERYTVGEKIDQLLELLAERGELSLSKLFEQMRSRAEIVVTFLAVLELIRLQQVEAVQSAAFDEIVIRRTADAAVAAGTGGDD